MLLLVVCCGDEPAPDPRPGSLEVLASFDPALERFPEGIAATANGLFVGMGLTSEVFQVSYTGQTRLYASLPQLPPSQGFLAGLTVGPDGSVYVCLTSLASDVTAGVYRIPPGGSTPELFASHPQMSRPNDVRLSSQGELFISDTSGKIFRVAPGGDAQLWIASLLLEGAPGSCRGSPARAVGANGISFAPDGDLYVANSDRGTVVRVPREDGAPGTPELFAGPDCDRLTGIDGLEADGQGGFYAAVFWLDSLVHIDEAGQIEVLDSGPPLDAPASLRLGVGQGRGKLFLTNFATDERQNPAVLSKVLE